MKANGVQLAPKAACAGRVTVAVPSGTVILEVVPAP